MKKLALTLLMTAITTGAVCLPAFAAETVTFNGGHIYGAIQGKPGTIQIDITNVDSVSNVKMTDAELMTYLDDDGTIDKIIYTDEVGKGYSIRSLVQALNKKDGVPVYYASSMPTITAKTPLTTIMCYWQGDDTTKGTLSLKYYLRSDYVQNGDNAKVYTAPPSGDYLIATGTTEKINKAGKYLLVVHDTGAIDQSPVSLLFVNVGTTSTATTVAATPAPPTANTTQPVGWVKTDGVWRYYDVHRAMKTGWLNDNGTWYYLNADGAMAHDTTTPDGYTVGSDGALIK